MKLSKRMLAVLCTLLMLASCFALPYGVAAEETTEAATSFLPGKVVATFQGETEATAVQGNDQWVGKSFTLSEAAALSKGAGSYVITAEVKIKQTYGFTDPEWMWSCLGDGNVQLVASDGSTTLTNPGGGYINMLKTAGEPKEAEWMQVYLPLKDASGNAFTGDDISKLSFNTYVHACRWDPTNYPTDNTKCKNGCTISYRNIHLVDMSLTPEGGLNDAVAMFTTPDVEIDEASTTTSGSTASIPYTNAMYNLMTSKMALSDLMLEFDIKRTGDGDITGMKNGQIRLYSGSTEHQSGQWSNGVVVSADTWYHISRPLSEFTSGTALTDASGITRVYVFDYNDGGIENFVSTYKNVKITHKAVTNLQDALDAAKTYVYDVDDNATAYETELNEARALFTDSTATYDDFVTALTELNAAKANLTNFRDVNYEVATFSSQAYTKTQTQGTSGSGAKQFYYDWRTADGLSSGEGYDLTDDGSTIGANRYMQMTVTLKKNDSYTGTVDSLDLLNYIDYRVRTNIGSEKRTNDYKLSVISKTVTDDAVVYTMEGLLDDSAQNAVEWNLVRDSIIFVYINQECDSNQYAPVTCTLSDVRIVNKTAESIEAQLEECAAGTFPAGKYTAESMASYLALKEQAQAMLDDDGATLQEKSQLIIKINAAKAEFVPVVTEYVQFGTPDTIDAFTNTGVEGSHSMSKTYALHANNLTGTETLDNMQLRLEVYVTRNDGAADASKTMVNGNLNIKGGTNEIKYSFGGLLSNMKTDTWNSVYIDMSSFSNVSVTELMNATQITLFAYNDLRGVTTDPGMSVQIRNVAIVDNTNVAAVAALAAAFEDVTKGGTVDYTTDSYAAYKAVYDKWYPVYETVDLTQADAAIAAMAEAYKLLVCVEPEVMTFAAWNNDYTSNAAGFYADWRTADQGMTDTSIRNHDNLVIRFDLSVAANDGYTLPETLTTTSMRLAVRKWNGGEDPDGKECSIEFGNKALIPSLDPTKVNSIEVPFTSTTGGNNTDGMLRDIILYMNFSELSEATGGYVFTIANARVVDVTKDNMAAALKADAETTLDELGETNGVVYDPATADDLTVAQAAALEVLAKEDPTYADLEAAQKAIDDAEAALGVVGHTVMTFTNFAKDTKNFMYKDAQGVYMNWSGANQGETDLSKYNKDNLVLRINFYVGSTDEINYPVPETVTLTNQRLALRSNVTGEGEKSLTFSGYDGSFDSQNGYIELSLAKATDGGINWEYAKDLIWWVKVTEFANDTSTSLNDNSEPNNNSGHYYINATSARIVDTTAEKNLGTVSTVGSGRVDITGGLNYGKDDVLTATNVNPATTFVGWKKNDSFAFATGDDDTLTLPVTGSQDVTAYFVEEGEVAVVFYGKYHRVVDVQIVKKSAESVTFPTLPAITGYTGTWVESKDEVLTAIATNESGHVSVMSNYVADGTTGFTVSLENTTDDTQTADMTYGFDERITVTARDAGEGEVFSHWTINGNVASYDPTLTFYVSGKMDVVAVFAAEAKTPELEAAINQASMTEDGNGTYTFSIIAQSYLPDGYELMEYGVIFAPKEETLKDMDNAVEGSYLKVVSSSRIANRQYMISLRQVKAGKTRCAVAYVVARNIEDGTILTAYSADIASKTAGA